jgi:protein phosphatase
MNLKYAHITHQGKNKRYKNQDALLTPNGVRQEDVGGVESGEIKAERAIFAISDGVSSSPKAEVASLKTLEFLSDSFANETDFLPSKVARQIQEKLSAAALSDKSIKNASCTLASALFYEDKLLVFNVGDSRVYEYFEGRLTRLSHDHSVLNRYIQDGEIDIKESAKYANRYSKMLDSSISANFEMDDFDVFVQKITPKEGALYLLCSDGLTDMLPDEEIAACLTTDLGRCVDALFQKAMDASGDDNISIIVVCFDKHKESSK